MRYRLRYLHHDLELGQGQFVVGRSASCQLSLDDPLVSRRHALLIVSRSGVTIEDLQSRNGVLVNTQRVKNRQPLRVGDRISIGSQELTLLEEHESSGRETASHVVAKRTLPNVPRVDASDSASVPRADLSDSEPSLTVAPAPAPAPIDSDDPSMVRRTDSWNLLGGVAEKALAMGRAEEAERMLASALNDVLEASRARKRLSPWIVDLAARFAAKLATGTAKGAWADYVIELYDLQDRPCPASVVDELYSALHKVNAIDLVRLRSYVARMREKSGLFGPAEKFLLQRLEGLERLAALR
jgi:predicted component of type VI protein secretion system